jgi:hypothetical protein
MGEHVGERLSIPRGRAVTTTRAVWTPGEERIRMPVKRRRVSVMYLDLGDSRHFMRRFAKEDSRVEEFQDGGHFYGRTRHFNCWAGIPNSDEEEKR